MRRSVKLSQIFSSVAILLVQIVFTWLEKRYFYSLWVLKNVPVSRTPRCFVFELNHESNNLGLYGVKSSYVTFTVRLFLRLGLVIGVSFMCGEVVVWYLSYYYYMSTIYKLDP